MRKIKKGRDNMDFLKTLFEAGALTWEQFSEAAKKAGFEVVNAAGDAYVPKADLDTKQRELDTANTTIRDLRETAKRGTARTLKKLEDDHKTLQTKYDTDTANIKRDAAIDLALVKAHARDPQLTRAALKMDEIKVDKEGAVTGLDAQIEGLKKDKTWLFEDDGSAGNNGKGAAGGNKPAAGGSAYTPAAGGKPNTAVDLGSAIAEHYNA